jgi:hypothetical protein
MGMAAHRKMRNLRNRHPIRLCDGWAPPSAGLYRAAKVELTIWQRRPGKRLTVTGLDVDESIKRGKPAAVRLIPVNAGEYVMRCSILMDAGTARERERFWFSENGQWMQKLASQTMRKPLPMWVGSGV